MRLRSAMLFQRTQANFCRAGGLLRHPRLESDRVKSKTRLTTTTYPRPSESDHGHLQTSPLKGRAIKKHHFAAGVPKLIPSIIGGRNKLGQRNILSRTQSVICLQGGSQHLPFGVNDRSRASSRLAPIHQATKGRERRRPHHIRIRVIRPYWKPRAVSCAIM